MKVPALATLAVSVLLAELPKLQTGHPGSRATSYVAPGNQLSATQLEGAVPVDRWYFLSEVDVEPPARSAAIAILGDSITDGHGVETNTNQRWTDFLLERLKASPATRSLGLLNLGIGGNRLVDDGLGPNAVARFGLGVLPQLVAHVYAPSHVSYLVQVLLEDLSIAILFVRFRNVLGLRWTLLLVALLFAAAHVPGLLARGGNTSDLWRLIGDVGLGVLGLALLQRLQDVWWFWMVHFALDMTQFYDRGTAA